VRGFCQVVRERDFRLIADSMENLSEEGMRVCPAEAVLTGETLLVSFEIPGFKVWVDVEACVTRVIHGRRPGEHARSLGLQFCDLAPWHRYLIRQALVKVPPVPVGARPGRRVAPSPRELAGLMPCVAPA